MERIKGQISVIVPVYNAEKYLKKCLDSLCNQTYINIEVICVNDGSTDASGKILDEFKKSDNRITVIDQPNRGESAARNRALGCAKGEYFAFVDCDDWIEANMYECLVKAINRENADIAIGGWIKETEQGSICIKNEKEIEKNVFGKNNLLRYLYERDVYREFAYMWDKLYRWPLMYGEEGGLLRFDEDLVLGGDVLYLGEIALKVKKAVYVKQPFYHYRQRQDSGCHSKDIAKWKDCLRAYLKLINIYQSNGVEVDIINFLKRFLTYHCACVAQMAYEQKNNKALAECQTLISEYQDIYQDLNRSRPERIAWLNKILSYRGE